MTLDNFTRSKLGAMLLVLYDTGFHTVHLFRCNETLRTVRARCSTRVVPYMVWVSYDISLRGTLLYAS